ncbi:MAG: TIR domain-containing protein, partial [Thioploca sp.]|nr:TIR domain-containing protein [Thioploca sp.]
MLSIAKPFNPINHTNSHPKTALNGGENLMFKDLFVSYGRRESLGFVGRLHRQLQLAGFDAWFDKVNIPDGEDYAARINHGIESAHNFAYVMAPRCLTSPYCLIELEYARILGKRVIPINQMVIFTTDDKALSASDQQVLHGFYAYHGIADPNITTTQAVLDRSLALIGRTDWLDAKETLTDDDCNQLAAWARHYENFWHHHDDPDYLHDHELPVFGQPIDPLAGVVERIITVLRRHQSYVQQQTHWLNLALHWHRHQRATSDLIVGKDRTAAEQWLLTSFDSGEQPPCEPPLVLSEFICEARKNAENLMTQAFICYDVEDKAIRDQIIQTRARHAITTWTHDRDIQTGADYTQAIQQGIEQADNFLLLLSPHSAQSTYCRQELTHALQYHKRIIPILIAATPEPLLPADLRGLQYLHLADDGMAAILALVQHDQTYFEQHKILLVRALQWLYAGKQPAFLLRGYNLEQAKTWWRLSERRQTHPPTPWHRALITASEAARGQLHTEVFISYSRKDSDFARKLNLALQTAGKTTWFDQESISSGVDFEAEIFNGIRSSDNFIFIISPDAIDSEYCEREVNFAAEQHKRFIPVRWRDTDPQQLPDTLQRLQWLDFLSTPFDHSFTELIQALELDRDHARQHTILQQRAHDWEEYQRSPDFLLNKTACQKALDWLDTATHKQPAPTDLQQTFIQTSQQALAAAEAAEQQRRAHELAIEQERREAMAQVLDQERQHAQRQRWLMLVIIFAWLISLLAGGYAFEQKHRIEQQKVEIEQQKSALETALQDAQHAKQLADQERQRAQQALIKAEAEEHKAKHQEQQAQTALADAQQQRQRAEQQTQLTEQQKQIAETQTQKAQQQEELAQQQAQVAQQAQRRAELNRHQAQQEARRAQQQSNIAQAERQHAQQQSALAQYQATRAQQQTDLAQQQKQLATQQSRFAQQQALTAQAQTIEADQQRQTAETAEREAATAKVRAEEQTKRAQEQERQALEQKQRADQQTQKAQQQSWRNESLLSASQAEREIEKQHFLNAAVFALQGLPKPLDDSENRHPYVGQAGAALSQVVIDKLPLHSRQLVGHESSVRTAAFSPDGQRVVTASADKTARVWDVHTGELRHSLVGHEDWVNSAAFSPDGQRVVTACAAIGFGHPIASRVTRPFFNSSKANRLGIAVISLDFSSIASC